MSLSRRLAAGRSRVSWVISAPAGAKKLGFPASYTPADKLGEETARVQGAKKST